MSIEEWYVDNILAESEGTSAHIDRNAVGSGSSTLATAAYGITARSGLTKEDGESDRDFAIRAAKVYMDRAKKSLGSDLWKTMPDSMKLMATDLQYNTGKANYSGFKRELKNKNWEAAGKQTLDIVGGAEKREDDQGNKYEKRIVMGGLGNRRGRLYNLAANDLGFAPVVGQNAINTGDESSKVIYYFGDNSVKEFDFNKPLSENISDVGFYEPQEVNSYADQQLTDAINSMYGGKQNPWDNATNVGGLDAVVAPLQQYTVRSGDNLTTIASNLGIPVSQLVDDNNITDPNMIRVGQTLNY